MKLTLTGLVLAVSLLSPPALAQTAPPVLKIEDGGTGGNTAASARANLGAAASGANADINSLTGLSTPLPAFEGGTGGTAGVSPTGSLLTTPEAVINIADYGGCSGATASDTANVNAAISAARSSPAYTGNLPVRVVGGLAASGAACAVTQVNITGFTRFGTGSRLIIEDFVFLCSGVGNICVDTLGSLNVQFSRVTIIGSATAPPMIGLQEGNFSPGDHACCIHTHYGLEITGSYTFAALYSAASESTTYYSPIVRNDGASLGAIATTGPLSGGSGYPNGTYSGVALSGSTTGFGAVANISVSGGAVTNVVLTNQGKQYAIGDVLTAPASSLGGAGSRFSITVTNIAQFAMVLDGQNHWGVSSPSLSVNWIADTYYTFTENNIIGGSLRYFAASNRGAPLWLGSVEGLRTFHVYMAQGAPGACVQMFDNNATYTLHNINEALEVECETANATYDVQLIGANASPNVSGLTLIDPLSTVNTAIFGLDSNITNVIAHNVNVKVGFTTSPVPLFAIGAASLWSLDGVVSMPNAWQFNAPATSLVSGLSGGAPLSSLGPLDLLPATVSTTGAYSCARRLSFKYAGPLCNLRRASDSASIDIYSGASGSLDRSSVSSFCVGTICYIQLMYDQSGNGNVALNSNSGSQPTLVLEGASLNYAACGSWAAGGNAMLQVGSNSSKNGLFANGGFASTVVNKTSLVSGTDRVLSTAGSGSGWDLVVNGNFQFDQYASNSPGTWISTTSASISGGHVLDVNYNSASLGNTPTIGVDGVSSNYQFSTAPSGAVSDSNALVIGNSPSSASGWPGDICEVLLVREALAPPQIDAIRRNQAVFYGIPAVQ